MFGKLILQKPNVMIMDNPSTQIRVVRPIAADRAEVTVYCIAPRGESERARFARLRKFEDFYLTAGMATSDDVSALEDTHAGAFGRSARWNEFNRGLTHMIQGADDDAKALGFAPVTTSPDWDHETLFHGLYRHWRDMMCGERDTG